MDTIEINAGFRKALDAVEGGGNVFITGRAGTGKSTLLQYFRDNTGKNIAVVAPTGVGAVNVGGQTIHSFFGFRPDITVGKVKKTYQKIRKAKLYRELEVLVVDEISMVRADLLDCVDAFLRLHGPKRGQPLGGIQLVFIGDLYQLPPVVTYREKKVFESYYDSPYFFSAKVMEEVEFEIVELTKIYRQTDAEFIDILNAVRNKSITEGHLELLNARFDPGFEAPEEEFYIYLTTTNAKAAAVNGESLARLPGREFSYQAVIGGEFEERSAPAPHVLSVKKGAQVMLVNNDREGRWINGTVGRVVDIHGGRDEEDILLVELNDGELVEVLPHTWEMYQFYYDEQEKKVDSKAVGSFTQYPLILAWSITIHKSQGKTFEKAIVDFDRGTFAHGQAYVALSRCVSLAGLVLKKPVEPRHIMIDWKVSKYLTGRAYAEAEKRLSADAKARIIERAAEEGSRVKIVYLKADNTKSRRVVSPARVGEMEYQGKAFLGFSGFDELRGEERVFRVDRVLEIERVG